MSTDAVVIIEDGTGCYLVPEGDLAKFRVSPKRAAALGIDDDTAGFSDPFPTLLSLKATKFVPPPPKTSSCMAGWYVQTAAL